MTGLSILARGDVDAKLEWVFSMYDINGDGYISRDELYDIINAIYHMVGSKADDLAARLHAEAVFQVFVLIA